MTTTTGSLLERKNTKGYFCWLDHHSFPETQLDFAYPLRKDGDQWEVAGHFCSLGCAKRFILLRGWNHLVSLFSRMCIEVYNVQSKVVPAPDPTCLENLCHDPAQALSLKRFREIAQQHTMLVTTVKAPFILQPQDLYTISLKQPEELQYSTLSSCNELVRHSTPKIQLQTLYHNQPKEKTGKEEKEDEDDDEEEADEDEDEEM